jgi:hypothetical protein
MPPQSPDAAYSFCTALLPTMPRMTSTGTKRALAKHRLSNNVGSVKHFLSTPPRALEEERHFALVERCAVSNQSPLAISIQVWNSVRPMHLFDRNLDHDS